jgi:uncharacterized protein YcbX
MNTQTQLTPTITPSIVASELRGYFVTLEQPSRDDAAAAPTGATQHGERAYAVRDNRTGEIVGSYKLINREPAQSALEIGATSSSLSAWDSPLTIEANLLLLESAFHAGFTSVVYNPDPHHTAVQSAITGHGAPEATSREITAQTWPTVETELRSRLAHAVRHSIEATVTQLWIYPLKSLDGCQVTNTTIGPTGGLTFDRCWQLVDQEGKVITAKQRSDLQRIRATWTLPTERDPLNFTLKVADRDELQPITGTLPNDKQALEKWFSQFLKQPAKLQYDEHGFPDDRDAGGPTIISAETLELFAREFQRLLGADTHVASADLIRRLRPNIVLTGTIGKEGARTQTPALWEDALYSGTAGKRVPFMVGPVKIEGNNPCTRCAVPARDPASGETTKGFIRLFTHIRENTRPAWAARQRFPPGGTEYYRLAVNTVIQAESFGRAIQAGAALSCDP